MATLKLLLQKQVSAPAEIRTSIDVHLKMIAGAVRGLAATNQRLRNQYRQYCASNAKARKQILVCSLYILY